MIFAQHYASLNRKMMMEIILSSLGDVKAVDSLETVHNFIDFEDWIIRKGAIRSYEGERMIIPFNMRDGILLCEGKSNGEWNCSAPHGAGRVMSRSEAKKRVSLDAFEETMSGIYSTSVCRGTLDESPFAYKDSVLIEEAIEPTAKIVNRIIPVYNFKDKSGGGSNHKKEREEKRIMKKAKGKKDRASFKDEARRAMDDYKKQ
jgi:RNA-splicing ligase RtcB